MVNFLAEVEDFDEEAVDSIVANYFSNTIRLYFKDKVDQNQVPFLNKFNCCSFLSLLFFSLGDS